MDQKVKAKWVAALRSGEYVQGRGKLHTRDAGGDKFCCLGVLCELAVKAGEIESPWVSNTIFRYGVDGEESYLPTEVMNWAGLDNARPTAGNLRTGDWAHLDTANDGGTPFETIANLIEQYL